MYSYEERLSNFDKARGIIGHECMNELLVKIRFAVLNINQMIISKNPQFTGISARQQLEFTTHLLLTD